MRFLRLLDIYQDNQIIITYPNFDPGYQYHNNIVNLKKEGEIKVIKHFNVPTLYT